MTTSDAFGKPLGTSSDSHDTRVIDPRVEKLAARFQDLHDAGQEIPVEVVCAEAPQLIEAVREYLSKVGKLEAILATQAPTNDTLRGSWAADNVLAAPQGPDELGRLGGYRVLKLIGQGGMGKVYLAEDVKLKRRVALKVLLRGGDQRFLREAQTLAKVEHDHIVTVYQIDEDRGTQFLAMPYLQGETLEKRLEKTGRLPLTESVRIAKQITLGLVAAHGAGVTHRDIKPSNIWLEAETDRVKILDFGLARHADADKMLTQEGAVVGTPAFMAPEQAQGVAVDHRADLFSLGCVLYQMISGISPFTRKDILSTLRALEMDTPELPTVRHPDTPGPLSDLAMKLLAKKPDDRPQTAKAVLETLQMIESDLISGKTTVKMTPPAAVKPASPKSRAFPLGAAVLGVVGCAALAAYLMLPPRTSDSTGGDKSKENGGQVAVVSSKFEPIPDGMPEVNVHGVEQQDFKIKFELLETGVDAKGILRPKVGQELRFKITVDEDAYVGLWYHVDDGSSKQFFPNKHDRQNFMKKGVTYQIPSNDSYVLAATASDKLERFYVYANTKRWDWNPRQMADEFRSFKDHREFEEDLRGIVLIAKDRGAHRESEASMKVFISR